MRGVSTNFIHLFTCLGFFHPFKRELIIYDPKLILLDEKQVTTSHYGRTQTHTFPARLLLVYGINSREEGMIVRNRHRLALCPIVKGMRKCCLVLRKLSQTTSLL